MNIDIMIGWQWVLTFKTRLMYKVSQEMLASMIAFDL